MKLNPCPLCQSNNTVDYSKDRKRDYIQCNNCGTIFVPPAFHLSSVEEKKRYDMHTNSKTDTYYRNFLSRIIDPIRDNLDNGHRGLDFGCGPGPILKELFAPHGIILEEYDLYYKNDSTLLKRTWDFIVTTEVVEHLKDPFTVIKQLWDTIKSGGLLAIMSCRYSDEIDFPSWYYKGDPTHITFFTKESFMWLANSLGATLEFFDKDITILKKN